MVGMMPITMVQCLTLLQTQELIPVVNSSPSCHIHSTLMIVAPRHARKKPFSINKYYSYRLLAPQLSSCKHSLSTPADCDDGLYCNGPESCDPLLGCQPGNAPTCPDQVCNEDLDRCADCATDSDCSDGNACNGIETCSSEGTCVPGTPLDCSDNDICTNDTCNPSVGCEHTNICPTCTPAGATCSSHSDCCPGLKCKGKPPKRCN